MLTTALGTGPAVAEPSPPGPKEAVRLARAWTVAPQHGLIGSDPAYVGGSVYYTEDAWPVSDPRSGVRITRRDAVTGRVLPFAAPAYKALVLTRPASDGVRLFTISAYENSGPAAHVRAYTLDGRTEWSRPLPGEKFLLEVVRSGPLVIVAGESGCDREPEAGCDETTVAAWRAADGRAAWQRTVRGGSPQVVAAAGRLTVSTSTGPGVAGLTALKGASGRGLWTRKGLAAGPLAAAATGGSRAAGNSCALRVSNGRRRWWVKDRGSHGGTAGDGGP